MQETMLDTISQLKLAKGASKSLLRATPEEKNEALNLIADELLSSLDHILAENKKDIEEGKKNNLTNALLDRLLLNEKRVEGMANSLRKVSKLDDPTGKTFFSNKHPEGMTIEKVSVPLGVICVIYEARPNVTTDAVGLALKSGNVIVLRGSQHATSTNTAVVEVIQKALSKSKLSPDVVQFIASKDRNETVKVLEAKELVDLIVPRGGEALKEFVLKHTKIPVIGAGGGTCHLYIDKAANEQSAIDIAVNAKTQRPGVCNAIETILVHSDIAKSLLPKLSSALEEKEVKLIGCEKSKELVSSMTLATDEDWEKEYLDLEVSIKIVGSIDEAIDHINKYGTLHSEAIVTDDSEAGKKFQMEVDASSVYINASTRFTDGEEFGFGSEIGISTQKLHARGPIGLEQLVTYKYLITGSGQVRK